MLKWIIGLLISSPLLFGGALYAASEYGGETVEIETFDKRGNSFATKLWVVDIHEEPWLRAGNPEAGWLLRMQQDPEIVLIRDGERAKFFAEIDEYESERINYMMREKYGLADQLISLIHDPEAVVAVRLVEPETH